MMQSRNVLILQQIEMWPTLFDWMNNTSDNSFKIKENEICIILEKQALSSQTLYKLQVKSTGQTGWILAGKYPSFEII